MSSTDGTPTTNAPDDVPAASRAGAAHRAAWHLYAALPRRLRMWLVRRLTPNYTVGALCIVEHHDRILLLRQHHRHGWTLPGGLMDRGESPQQAVTREVAEETGLQIVPAAPLTFVIDAQDRRVDVIFRVAATAIPTVTPSSEATRATWLRPDEVGAVDRSTAQALSAYREALSSPNQIGVVLNRPTPTS